jgi:hypothetical protein
MQPLARQEVRAWKTISLWLLSHFSWVLSFPPGFLHWLYGIKRLFLRDTPLAQLFLVQTTETNCTRLEDFFPFFFFSFFVSAIGFPFCLADDVTTLHDGYIPPSDLTRRLLIANNRIDPSA